MRIKTVQGFLKIDRRLFFLVQSKLKSKISTRVLTWITKMFNPASYVAIVSVLFLSMLYFDVAVKKPLILFSVSQSITFVLKRIFCRMRPYKALDGAKLSLKEPKDPHSFPSGHTASAFMLAFMVLTWSAVISIPFFILSVLCGLSRVYLGVHYPSDVIGGGVLSALIYYAVSKLIGY